MDAPHNNAIAPGRRVTRRFEGEFRVPARQSGTRCLHSPDDILHVHAASRHERVDLDKQRVPFAYSQMCRPMAGCASLHLECSKAPAECCLRLRLCTGHQHSSYQ